MGIFQAVSSAEDGVLNLKSLKNWKRDRRRLLAGENLKFNIGVFGDSWMQKPDRGLSHIATTIQTKYGNGGGGYASFSWPPTNTAYKFATPYTDKYPLTITGAWTTSHFGQSLPDMGRISSTAIGDRVTIGFPAGSASARLFYTSSAGAAIRYSWDGGSTWTALDVSVIGGQANLVGLPSVTGTLILEVVTGNCILGGVYFLATASGVVINKLSSSGGRISQFAALNQSNWQNYVDDLNLDLCVIAMGLNDKAANRTPDEFANDVQTVITTLKAASAASATGSKIPDILLVAQPERQSARSSSAPYNLIDTFAQPLYTAKLIELAVANDCAFLDMQPSFGVDPAAINYGYNVGLNLFDSDFTHVNLTRGAFTVAEAILGVLL